MLREGDEADAITGLQAKTHFGRPDWAKEFDSISLSHPESVYICIQCVHVKMTLCLFNTQFSLAYCVVYHLNMIVSYMS